jgi:pyridoxine 5-phosphate synthase
MAKLSVNVNKIATMRNARGGPEPDLMTFVKGIVGWGADGITIHPRADRRHITPEDARMVASEVRSVETNFEGDVREEFLDLVLQCKPTQCTLVPVSQGEITSNHGWLVARAPNLAEVSIGHHLVSHALLVGTEQAQEI